MTILILIPRRDWQFAQADRNYSFATFIRYIFTGRKSHEYYNLHGPRCFLQERPGLVHLCMGAYGEHSSRLRNFEGFKLVTNLKEKKEAKCKNTAELQWIDYLVTIMFETGVNRANEC